MTDCYVVSSVPAPPVHPHYHFTRHFTRRHSAGHAVTPPDAVRIDCDRSSAARHADLNRPFNPGSAAGGSAPPGGSRAILEGGGYGFNAGGVGFLSGGSGFGRTSALRLAAGGLGGLLAGGAGAATLDAIGGHTLGQTPDHPVQQSMASMMSTGGGKSGEMGDCPPDMTIPTHGGVPGGGDMPHPGTPVPEPATLLLLLPVLAVVILTRRWRRVAPHFLGERTAARWHA